MFVQNCNLNGNFLLCEDFMCQLFGVCFILIEGGGGGLYVYIQGCQVCD